MDGKVAKAKEARKAASLLLLASARGYLDDVKTLLASDDAPLPTDGAVADRRRATPAHYAAGAAAGRSVPVLRHLWSIGAELDAEDAQGRTPLHYAAAGRSKEAVEFLVATAKVWPGAPDGAGDDTPLHLVARSGDVELAQVFLKAVGSSSSCFELLKDKNKRGLMPLGEALLLPVSSSTSAAAATAGNGDKSGPASQIPKEDVFAMADALFEASSSSASLVQLLRQPESSPRGWPLLHVLSAAGSAEGVEWLLLRLEKEEEKNAPSSSIVNEHSSEATGSLTSLHAAALGGNAKVAELLLGAGADVTSVDGAGRTPAEAFEAAFAAAATKAAAVVSAAAAAAAAAATTSCTSVAPPPLPLATAEEAKKLRKLLQVSSSSVPSSSFAAKKKGSSGGNTPSSSSVEAFSNNSNSNSDSSSFSFSFESPAATFKALPRAEQLATAKKWAQLEADDALESATSMFSPAAFEQARLARGMRHARAIAQVVAALHDDEDFQEAAKLKRVKEAVAVVRQDPASIGRFQEDPKTMDVLSGLRKLQAVCAANGRHVVPFEELVVESGERYSKKEEDADRVAGLGKLHEDHLCAAVAAASEDDPKEAAAAAARTLEERARGSGAGDTKAATAGAGAKKAEPTAGGGLIARARAVLAAASADADAANAAAAARGEGEVAGDLSSTSSAPPSFDWSTFWKSLSKAMAASLLRAAIAFVVLWMVMRATSPPPATVAVPRVSTATEAEL